MPKFQTCTITNYCEKKRPFVSTSPTKREKMLTKDNYLHVPEPDPYGRTYLTNGERSSNVSRHVICHCHWHITVITIMDNTLLLPSLTHHCDNHLWQITITNITDTPLLSPALTLHCHCHHAHRTFTTLTDTLLPLPILAHQCHCHYWRTIADTALSLPLHTQYCHYHHWHSTVTSVTHTGLLLPPLIHHCHRHHTHSIFTAITHTAFSPPSRTQPPNGTQNLSRYF